MIFERPTLLQHRQNNFKEFNQSLVISQIKLERMDRNNDTFDVSAEVYRKYQMAVHNDSCSECSPSEFYEFLVNTPLKVFVFVLYMSVDLCVFVAWVNTLIASYTPLG